VTDAPPSATGGGANDGVRRAAEIAELRHRGRPLSGDEAAAAERALSDNDERVRASALATLVHTAGHDALVWAAWSSAVDDGSAAVRRRAAELAPALPRDNLAGITGTLVRMLSDRDVTVVEAAAWALGELAGGGTDTAVVDAVSFVARDHGDPIAREAAVAALGALGDPAGLPAILAACSDRPAVRRRAVLALAPFSGDEVDAALARALTDHDWQVRQAAEDLLG
jgi:HEAT repeat protein